MFKRLRTILILVIVIAALFVTGVILYVFVAPVGPINSVNEATSTQDTDATPEDQDNVTQAVVNFGQVEQEVSLLAPDASSTIASVYAPYVTPTLLAQWEADPQSAPGRLTSSPWPDHLAVDSVTKTAAGYHVNADLILMTSQDQENGTNAGDVPVTLDLINQGGAWLISSYEAAPTNDGANGSDSSPQSQDQLEEGAGTD